MSYQPRSAAATPSPEAVRQELQRILCSPVFANAARSQRFLTYIVEQTLAGQRDSIKELILGIEVFHRPGDFDPRADPIVRVEAVKLRKRLQEYYEEEGASSRLRIDIPKPGYIPHFDPVEPVSTPQQRAAQNRSPWKYGAALAGLVALATGGYWFLGVNRRPATIPSPSIVVLPFVNFSPDPANEYFADGIVRERREGQVQPRYARSSLR